MVIRPFKVLISCICFILIIQSWLPKAMALRNIPNIDEFMIEDQRTHKRQNYVVQRALNDEMMRNIDNIGPAYVTESFEPNTVNSEELPTMLKDYANMIRNDIILLDNSVETRTRKRGNIKKIVKKYNQVIPDPPCSCESGKEFIPLGPDTYPQKVESRNCSEEMCPAPYRCKEIFYSITVLKRKAHRKEESPLELPCELNQRWIAHKVNVTIGCACSSDSIEVN